MKVDGGEGEGGGALAWSAAAGFGGLWISPSEKIIAAGETVNFSCSKAANWTIPSGAEIVPAGASTQGKENINIKFNEGKKYSVEASFGTTATAEITAVKAKIESIEFTSDHEDSEGNNVLVNNKTSWSDSGSQYTNPEWVAGDAPKNYPISHTISTKLEIRITVKVEPSELTFDLKADGDQKYVSFEVENQESTGENQAIAISANDKLPDSIGILRKTVPWRLIIEGQEFSLGSTGEHEIFMTFDTPITQNQATATNVLTYYRISQILSQSCITGKKDRYDISAGIQKWINTSDRIDDSGITITTLSYAQPFWLLLDGVGKGQCAQCSVLMSQACRLLGISAAYKHVYARSKLDANVSGVETRDVNGKKQVLWMYFDNAGNLSGWNKGEACNVVNEVYFSALTSNNYIGKAGKVTNGITAKSGYHSVLLQLDKGSGTLQWWKEENSIIKIESVPVPTE